MANTIYEATLFASKSITATFDMVWAIDAGLWNFRQAATQYYQDHPNASPHEAKDALVSGRNIHGLNPKRIALELTWDYEEQYVAELLLINGIAIFDSWVDSFIDCAIVAQSNNQKKKIKEAVKRGDFFELDNALTSEITSTLSGYFHFTAQRQDAYINNLNLVYKYFKSCRNCCAHGNRTFSKIAETNYGAIKLMTKEDCGVKEFPQITETVEGNPLKLFLRGVVGFYGILIRIINHYDIMAADKKGVESEVIRRWSAISSVQLPSSEMKRNRAVRNYMKSINMCPCYSAKTSDFCAFLLANNSIS